MNQYDIFKPKQTKYKGIWFRSDTEAKTAEAFDRLHVKWEYESRCFRHNNFGGGQYTPDFWLPEISTYVEVVGQIDDDHWKDATVFCMTQNAGLPEEWPDEGSHYPLMNDENPCFVIVTGNGELRNWTRLGYEDGWASHDVSISTCSRCGMTFFIQNSGLWACPCCGGDHGKHHGCRFNLFEFAGMKTYG